MCDSTYKREKIWLMFDCIYVIGLITIKFIEKPSWYNTAKYEAFVWMQVAANAAFIYVRYIIIKKLYASDGGESAMRDHRNFEVARSFWGVINYLVFFWFFHVWSVWGYISQSRYAPNTSGYFNMMVVVVQFHIVFWATIMPIYSCIRLYVHNS